MNQRKMDWRPLPMKIPTPCEVDETPSFDSLKPSGISNGGKTLAGRRWKRRAHEQGKNTHLPTNFVSSKHKLKDSEPKHSSLSGLKKNRRDVFLVGEESYLSMTVATGLPQQAL